MTWEKFAKLFINAILPFGFLASTPLILSLTADIGPVQRQGSILAALTSGLCIALIYTFYRSASRKKQRSIFSILAALSVILLLAYVYFESVFVYRATTLEPERRVRGYIYVSDQARDLANEYGSPLEILKRNNYESDGIFTESSRIQITVLLFGLWVALFACACSAIASFALFEYNASARARAKSTTETETPP